MSDTPTTAPADETPTPPALAETQAVAPVAPAAAPVAPEDHVAAETVVTDDSAPETGCAAPEPAEPAVSSEAGAAPDAADAPATTSAEVAPAAQRPPELSPAATAARLADLFPALFGPGPARPVKLRIQADIQQRAPGVFTKKGLSTFLHRHTTSTPYLKALVAAAARIDLDGAPAGEVADEHRQAATVELDRRRAIMDTRRAAEREAHRAAEQAARRQARSPGATGQAPDTASQAVPEAAPGALPAPRPPRERPRRDPARPGQERHAQEHSRPPRQDRPPRPDRRPPQQPPADQQAVHEPQPQAERPPAPPARVWGPEDDARRDRALLLRAFESSPLKKANFCVLKGIAEAELDTRLALAQQERDERAKDMPPERSPGGRADAGPGAEFRLSSRHEPRHDRGDRPRGGPQGGRPPKPQR